MLACGALCLTDRKAFERTQAAQGFVSQKAATRAR